MATVNESVDTRRENGGQCEEDTEIQVKRAIFLQYAKIFRGNHAAIRRRRVIEKKVIEYQSSAVPTLSRYGVDRVVDVLSFLLERNCFSSQEHALREVPELFDDVSASEQDYCRSLIDHTSASTASTTYDIAREADLIGSNLPTVYPTQFPLHAQHQVLTLVQRQLEQSCFDFTVQHMPELIDEQRWDCPEAIEINKWNQVMLKMLQGQPKHLPIKVSYPQLVKIAKQVNKLRHAAVHRDLQSTSQLEMLFEYSLKFLEALEDETRVGLMEKLLEAFQKCSHRLVRTSREQEEDVAAELQELAHARAAFVSRERELRTRAHEQHLATSLDIGTQFAKIANRIFY